MSDLIITTQGRLAPALQDGEAVKVYNVGNNVDASPNILNRGTYKLRRLPPSPLANGLVTRWPSLLLATDSTISCGVGHYSHTDIPGDTEEGHYTQGNGSTRHALYNLLSPYEYIETVRRTEHVPGTYEVIVTFSATCQAVKNERNFKSGSFEHPTILTDGSNFVPGEDDVSEVGYFDGLRHILVVDGLNPADPAAFLEGSTRWPFNNDAQWENFLGYRSRIISSTVVHINEAFTMHGHFLVDTTKKTSATHPGAISISIGLAPYHKSYRDDMFLHPVSVLANAFVDISMKKVDHLDDISIFAIEGGSL